ncbi:MAG: hypothetical protein NPINA01_10480 [Nitrospinaceae bacterium]|nr:MAG: hypothetical protein NPINA01_10480 [Nitrospinaceae bacterium]
MDLDFTVIKVGNIQNNRVADKFGDNQGKIFICQIFHKNKNVLNRSIWVNG